MQLTDKGYENIQEILRDHCAIKVNRAWIDENMVFLSRFFDEDTPEVREAMHVKADEEEWWTFETECNSGGIFDSYPRDILIDGAAVAMTGGIWPRNGDTQEYKDQFYSNYQNYVDKNLERMI